MRPKTRQAADTSPRVRTLGIFAGADRGMAMGHVDGKVAFVPFAAPGDRVEVEIVRERKNYIEARLLRVLEPSPRRREAPCPHFGSCGGCQWQHLPYADQLEIKERSFRGLLRSRLRGVGEALFRDPIASPAEWGYRNRVALKIREVGGTVLVGFFARGTHRVIPVERCPVAHPVIQGFLEPLREFLDRFRPARGALPQVDLQVDARRDLRAVFHLLRPLAAVELQRLHEFLTDQLTAGGYLQSGRKASLLPVGPEPFPPVFSVRCGHRDLHLRVPPGGFVQANDAVNQLLVDELLALAPLFGNRLAADLFCGAGNFTLPLAAHALRVAAAEGYPPAARAAEQNAHANGIGNVAVQACSAREGLTRISASGSTPDFVVLDPPREGAADAIPELVALGPAHILYVSCAAPTLVRDLQVLLPRGYRVVWTRIADMFPQTGHVESLTLLRRADGHESRSMPLV